MDDLSERMALRRGRLGNGLKPQLSVGENIRHDIFSF